MAGSSGNQTIVINTDLVDGGEYVQAFNLIPYFPNRWQYDALSGTVIFTRKDGVTVGVKTGDERIVIGQKVFHTGTPLLRRNGHIYIPFYIVDTFLFPNIRFKETNTVPSVDNSPTPIRSGVPSGNIFVYPTPTPAGQQPVATPTAPRYTFGTPTPISSNTGSVLPIVPSGVIVLDPGNDKENPGPSGIAGLRECDLTLAICQKLVANLREYKNFSVVMTRNAQTDGHVSIEQRTAIANQNKGDLFISIQCGALFHGARSTSRGVVYFMNETLDQRPPSLQWISSGSQLVLWHDAYKPHVTESLRIAKMINDGLRKFYSTAGVIQMDSHPRPGRLACLRGLTMPGVLIELGNLDNQQTAKYLSRTTIQQEIADELEVEITNFFYERSGMDARGGIN